MHIDDKIRPSMGLVACLRDMGNGTSRLFFDDVFADKGTNPINWSYANFFSFTPELSNADLKGLDLSSAQLEQIGVAVVARLLVLAGNAK